MWAYIRSTSEWNDLGGLYYWIKFMTVEKLNYKFTAWTQIVADKKTNKQSQQQQILSEKQNKIVKHFFVVCLWVYRHHTEILCSSQLNYFCNAV